MDSDRQQQQQQQEQQEQQQQQPRLNTRYSRLNIQSVWGRSWSLLLRHQGFRAPHVEVEGSTWDREGKDPLD